MGAGVVPCTVLMHAYHIWAVAYKGHPASSLVYVTYQPDPIFLAAF